MSAKQTEFWEVFDCTSQNMGESPVTSHFPGGNCGHSWPTSDDLDSIDR